MELILIIAFIAWIFSPPVLIVLLIKSDSENKKLRDFVDDLCRRGRISNSEYLNLKAEKENAEMPFFDRTAERNIFSDSRDHSRVYGGYSAVGTEKKTENKSPDIPVSMNVNTAETAPEKSAASPVKRVEISEVSENTSEKTARSIPVYDSKSVTEKSNVQNGKQKIPENTSEKTARSVPVYDGYRSENNGNGRAAAMSVLMMIGIIFVVLAGLVFSTAVWVNLGNAGRAAAIGIISAMFFGISAFTGKKLKLERTSFAFYVLGTFFTAITFITAGYFGLMGSYFSVMGKGSLLLYAAALIITGVLSVKGRSIFDRTAAAYISAFSFGFSAVLVSMQFSSDIGGFALIAAIFTAVLNAVVFISPLEISDKWEKPVITVTALLSGMAVLCGAAAVIADSSAVCAVSAVFVIRCTAAAVMGFRENNVYKKSFSAAAALAVGSFFLLGLGHKLSSCTEMFVLFAALTGMVFAAAEIIFGEKIPHGWKTSAKVTAFILNTIGIISSIGILINDMGQWDPICFIIAAVYTVTCFAVGIAAAGGYKVLKETFSAFAAMFTGMTFSAMLIFELSFSPAVTAVCFTVMLLVLVNAVYSLSPKISEGWLLAFDASSAVLGIISVCCSMYALLITEIWDAACYTAAALYIIQSAFITISAYKGHEEYSKCRWAAVSQSAGIVFALLLGGRFAEDTAFTLFFTVFAAIYLNLVHTFDFKKPEHWKTPLNIFSVIMGISGALLTIGGMSDTAPSYAVYICAGIFIAYSLLITVLAFMGHDSYKKAVWSAVSQITGIMFTVIILGKVISEQYLFVLLIAILAVLYSAAVSLTFLKSPEKWVNVTKAVNIIFNIIAAVISAAALIAANGNWNIYCGLTALLYIAYTAVCGLRGNNSLFKAAECTISAYAAYNVCCIIGNIYGTETADMILAVMLFALAAAHHYVKPIRTGFSDIFLPAALSYAAGVCAGENGIYGIIAFILLLAVMIVKAAEKECSLSAIFRAALPFPVTGAVFTFVIYNISDNFGIYTAIGAAALAVIGTVLMIITRKSDITFYSFAVCASLMIFLGTDCGETGLLIALAVSGAILTAAYGMSKNNCPSLLTVMGIAAVLYRLAEIAEISGTNVSLIFAAVFAAVSAAASRIFYSRRFITRGNGRFSLDTCCFGIPLSIALINTDSEKVMFFAVMTIFAVFAANLARKEHADDFNRAALTVGYGLFTIALIGRPFLTVSDEFLSGKITLGLICVFGFVFSRLWAKYPKLSENFSTAVYGISFVCLIIDALSHQNLLNTFVVLGVSAAILLYSFIAKKKRWFAVSSISLTGLTLYIFRDFFLMIDWWIYLLIVGLILIAVSSANEYFIKKGKELKEKAGRFFEDWSW